MQEGETTATNQVIREKVDLDGLLNRAFELTDYHEKREAICARECGANGRSSGLNESTKLRKASASLRSCTAPDLLVPARCIWRQWSALRQRRRPGGILAASTEIGQGTNTIFAQIAAEALGVDDDLIEVAQPDTGNVPNSGPTVASRTSWWSASWLSRRCLV